MFGSASAVREGRDCRDLRTSGHGSKILKTSHGMRLRKNVSLRMACESVGYGEKLQGE